MQFLYLDCYEVKGLDFIQVPVELTNFIIYKCQVNMVQKMRVKGFQGGRGEEPDGVRDVLDQKISQLIIKAEWRYGRQEQISAHPSIWPVGSRLLHLRLGLLLLVSLEQEGFESEIICVRIQIERCFRKLIQQSWSHPQREGPHLEWTWKRKVIYKFCCESTITIDVTEETNIEGKGKNQLTE